MKLFTPKMMAKALGMKDPLASNFCSALEQIGFINHVGTQKIASGKGKGTRVFTVAETVDPADFLQKLDDLSQDRKDLTGPNSVIVLFSDEPDEPEPEDEPDLTESDNDPDVDLTP